MIKLRRMRWMELVARVEEKRNARKILVGKPEGKRPLERPKRMWVDHIKMGPCEIGWGTMDWFDLAQDRYQWRTFVNTVINRKVT
jgi:hypothetical protein